MNSYLFFFAHYFTFYTFLGSLIVVAGRLNVVAGRPLLNLNPWFVAIIQGMAWIVLFNVLFIYAVFGIGAIQRFYRRFFGEFFENRWYVLLFDISLHVLPALLVGFPSGTPIGVYGVGIAYLLFIAWYMYARQRWGLATLYIREMDSADYDRLVFVYMPLLWSVILMIL